MNRTRTHIDFVIGEEKRIADIVSRTEIEPLLRSLVLAGPLYASILDEDNLPLCQQGNDAPLYAVREIRYSLLVEGEPKGTLVVAFDANQADPSDALALLARDAVQSIITNNLKRMLTTEIHTSVVNDSYEELVNTNKCLTESERCYRELALSLEQKVEERTAELQKAYTRMLQQEKLAAVGSLAAGMAHEINNPNGFVRCNLVTFSRYFQKAKDMLNLYQLLIANNIPLPQLQLEIENKRRELKLDFVFEDATKLLEQSIEGTDRINRIISNFRSFSHVDEDGETAVDLNEELKRTEAVLAPQIVGDTLILFDLQPLPLFGCHAGLISQAFLSIIQNALLSRPEGLELKIASRHVDGVIEIDISDNGCGIAPDKLLRVFDPFYSTRDVGSGTGMGLTVAREIIQDSGGTIQLFSQEGDGTSVLIRLPLTARKR